MIRAIWKKLVRLRRWLSRNETIVRWLGLSSSVGTSQEPGLVLIQIDGLSRVQFEKALKKRRMPFLRKLLRKRNYRLSTMYSGLPSSTPAVQGEIFYGVRCAVPAFGYRDPATQQIVAMFDSGPACRVQERLAGEGAGLLAEGSAYSNIYSGGAAEPHFCAVTMGWNSVLGAVNPLKLLSIVFWNAWSIVRIVALMILELCIALKDFVYGQIEGRDLLKELKIIPSRIGVSVLLRELIAIGASVDATRGLSVIQCNFLGYDEQAHRRGPSSKFAHWTLLGIDDAIKRIYKAARRSQRRRYSLLVYSDHGQERTISYSKVAGRSIHEVVADAFGETVVSVPADGGKRRSGHQTTRAQWLKKEKSGLHETAQSETKPAGQTTDAQQNGVVQVASLGPIGHVYAADHVDRHRLDEIGQWLATNAGVPLVLRAAVDNKVVAWTKAGEFELPRDSAQVLGVDHPFLDAATRDLVCLCQHPSAGDLVLSGYSRSGPMVTFAEENGAHAGPGVEETHAFVLSPPEVELAEPEQVPFRPRDLRHTVLRFLARNDVVEQEVAERRHDETRHATSTKSSISTTPPTLSRRPAGLPTNEPSARAGS